MNLLTDDQQKLIEKITKDHAPTGPNGMQTYPRPNCETVWKLLRIIDLQGKALDKAVEQRDGYRNNYHEYCKIQAFESRQIAEDNDKELQKIMNGAGEC